jgi:predicted nuclease with TOPRIM domain
MPNTEQKSSDLDVHIQRLEANESRLTERLAEVRKNLEALRTAKAFLKGESRETEPISTISPKELHNKTQLEALEYIAQHSDNRLRISVAKTLMSKAGLMRGNKKNFYNILYTIIKRSERYRHIAPGEYELLPEDEKRRVMAINKGFGAA